MTEAEARDLLAHFNGVGGLEALIARRPWKAERVGWTVAGELDGFAFRVEVLAAGLRITASAAGVRPAVWEVPAPRAPCDAPGRL